jgi:hypothetical protein
MRLHQETLAELGILAAPAIEQTGIRLLTIPLALAAYAEANTRQGLAPGFRNRLFTFLAVRQALTLGQIRAGPLEGILHGAVNLVLYRTIP